MEEQGCDEVGEPIRMGEGDDSEIGLLRMEFHGVDDVPGIGGELFRGEGDEAWGTGGAGGEFEVGDVRRRGGEGGGGLARFERTDGCVGFPGAEDFEEEGDSVAAGEADRGSCGRGVGGGGQLGECPRFTRARQMDGGGVGVTGDDIAPESVQHCGACLAIDSVKGQD